MNYVTIQTTQNVAIDYPLANVGLRIGAFLIDSLSYILLVWLLLVLLPSGLFSSMDSFVITYFLIFFGLIGYFFVNELVSRGQTIGKKILGLRVIRLDGEDPTPADFLIRAIFLLPDVIFSFGVPAVLLTATSRHHQRLGDMVASTAVILNKVPPGRSLQEILNITQREDYEPEFPGVQRYTNADMLIVKASLDRSRRYGNEAHRRAVRQLANKIAEDLGLDKKAVDYPPAKFLEVVLYDYIVLTR